MEEKNSQNQKELLDPEVKNKITIILYQDGELRVNGPLENEPLALWMIEKAKDAIKRAHMPKPKIMPVKGNMLNFARKKRF